MTHSVNAEQHVFLLQLQQLLTLDDDDAMRKINSLLRRQFPGDNLIEQVHHLIHLSFRDPMREDLKKRILQIVESRLPCV
ncbi:MAG TPA: hypothetical protein DHV52_00050 [Parachlamydiales bacterium]|nr:hypothetical protein [Parachlamydiales bacterium]